MSIWSTTHTIMGKKYEASHADPRTCSISDELDVAMVADYVYLDDATGERVLPYARVSVGPESILLTEHGAKELRDALTNFIDRPKWRAQSRNHAPDPRADDHTTRVEGEPV